MTQDGVPVNGGGNPWIARVWRGVLDVLLPPMCLGCGETVEGTAALCTACWKKTRFLSAPACACCGLPFEAAAGPDALCGECIRERPPFARARAAFVYDEKSRGMILAFKHGDRTELAPAFAHWLTRAGADLIADAAVIVPVPLHWTRLFTRRYNQAALLAHELARLSGVPAATGALVRHRRTPAQGHMSREMRRRNLAGAFAVAEGHRDKIAGRRVLLVDDVLTTGATVNACARVLLAAGAGAVDVLTLARVVRAE